MSDDLMNWLLMGTQVPDFERRRQAADEIERLRARVAELESLVRDFMNAEIDYMRLNCLGDPEKQHNVKRARALLKGTNYEARISAATEPAEVTVQEAARVLRKWLTRTTLPR